MGVVELGMTQTGAPELGAFQVSAPEVGPFEMGIPEFGAAEVRVAKIELMAFAECFRRVIAAKKCEDGLDIGLRLSPRHSGFCRTPRRIMPHIRCEYFRDGPVIFGPV